MSFAEDVLTTLKDAAQASGGAQALAEAAGINLPTLTRWIRGERDPRLSVLGRVMDYLGVTLSTASTSASGKCPDLEAECARLRKLVAEKEIRLDELRALLRPASSDELEKRIENVG